MRRKLRNSSAAAGHVHELQLKRRSVALDVLLLLFVADQERTQQDTFTVHRICEGISLAERTVLSAAKTGR